MSRGMTESFTSRSFPSGTVVKILETTTTKTLRVRCAAVSPLSKKRKHDMGAFLQAQLAVKLSFAACVVKRVGLV